MISKDFYLFNANVHVHKDVTTYEKYVALPKAERERRVSFWLTPWYKAPWSYTWNPLEEECEATKIDRFLKKNYPIQFFVRELAIDIKYWCKDKKWAVISFYRDWVPGRRTEMRKKVFPRHHTDLVEMIVTFHLQVLIEFVEREEALANNDYTTNETDEQFAAELRECYEYASAGRAKMAKAIDAEATRAYNVSRETGANANTYKKLIEMENEVMDYDTKVCEWVVRNRNRLWV